MASGAIRSHVLDVREEFVRDFVMPTLKADALSDGRYPMATAIGRPLIAKKLVEIARLENATIVAHGCSGRDRVRLGNPLRALDPLLTELAFVDEWGLTDAAIASYADRLGISSAGLDDGRVDDNVWGRTVGRRGDDAVGGGARDAVQADAAARADAGAARDRRRCRSSAARRPGSTASRCRSPS